METRIAELENQVEQLRFQCKLLTNLVMGHLDRIQAEREYDELLAGSRQHEADEYPASELQQLESERIVTNV